MTTNSIAALAVRMLFIGASISLAGCATAYQSKSFTGGFSETDLGPTTFKIGFAGNGFTSAERASDFAMLRAADKSLELGCNYFGIMNDSEGGSTGSVTVGSATYGRHSAFGTSSTFPIFKPNTTLLVKCFPTQQSGDELFDAHFIAHSIRAKYRMPESVAMASQSAAPQAIQVQDSATAAAPVASTNMAHQVLAAQRIATSQSCGDVSAEPDGNFETTCSAGTMVIQCEGDSCKPIRMKSH